MHDIEPFWNWRDDYASAEDKRSPFFGRQYSEFHFKNRVYNYYIHPQWDEFGSSTLYLKQLYTDYEEGFVILELIGEWNDTLHNDIKELKREVIEPMIDEGIYKFVLICENVLNFHGSDEDYYEEWYDDIRDQRGWICLLNTLPHVTDELHDTHLDNYLLFGKRFNEINWRRHKPAAIFHSIEALVNGRVKRLGL